MRKLIASLATVIITLGVLAPSAYAVVTKSGSESCPQGQVGVKSRGTDTVKHYYPSGTWKKTFQNGYEFLDRYSYTGQTYSTWKVTSTGALTNYGTYDFCTGV